MSRTTVVMFSHPDRKKTMLETVGRFAARGNRTVILIWDGKDVPESRNAIQNKDITDFRALIKSPHLDNSDLLLLEDDLDPCINAIEYMAGYHGPGPYIMTSFYNPGRPMGYNLGFIFSQAFKLPWEVIRRMRTEPFPTPHPNLQRDGIDQLMDRYLKRWNNPFYQHRSVVEHVGEKSTWCDSPLTDPGRQSIDWPGPTVDALTFAWHGTRTAKR